MSSFSVRLAMATTPLFHGEHHCSTASMSLYGALRLGISHAPWPSFKSSQQRAPHVSAQTGFNGSVTLAASTVGTTSLLRVSLFASVEQGRNRARLGHDKLRSGLAMGVIKVEGQDFSCRDTLNEHSSKEGWWQQEQHQLHDGLAAGASFICGDTENKDSSPEDRSSRCWQETGQEQRCRLCPYSSFSIHDIISHERTHTNRRFHCRFCPKAFTHNSHLLSHERIHTGEKPYKCRTCPKTFARSSHLACHEKVHTEEKPFACGVCGTTFRHHKNLTRHERIHEGDRPHQCENCGKAFVRREHLTAHLRKIGSCDEHQSRFSRRDT